MFTLGTVGLTVAAYILSHYLLLRFRPPLLNVLVLGTTMVMLVLCGLHIPYEAYIPGRDIMTFLLGPATVALALPLYNNRSVLKRYAVPLLLGLCLGTLSSIATALMIGRLGGLDRMILNSLATKSVTTPIAIEIANLIHGDPALATAFVVATGIMCSVFGLPLLSYLRINNPVARGLAMGTTAHALGTATALKEGGTQGAMAGVATVLAAIFTSLIASYFFPLFLP